MRLSFHGAAGTVTGSKHLLQAAGRRVLLDAGMFQGRRKLRQRNWAAPAFDPASVDELVLSHTHIDHVGILPRLVKLGLSCPVHLTPAAYDLAELMLLDAAKIQEEDARHANKKGWSKHNPALPLYTTEDANRALELRRALPFGQWRSLDGGDGSRFKVRFHQAGHLLGSAFVELRLEHRGRELTVVFSGDIGRYDLPLHPDPVPPPACDVMILESTYGDRNHTTESFLDQIEEPFRRTLRRGGTVLIPAFAVGRSQQVTLVLRRLMREGRLPEVPIHIDSPMAVNATGIYSRFLDERNLDPSVFEDGRLRLFPENVHFHRSVEDSKRLNRLPGPRIILSASGMMTAGRVLHHLKNLAPDPDNLLLLVGYQAEGTRGRKIVEGAPSVKIHGQHVDVNMKVLSVQGLSGHGDRDELVRWVSSAPAPPRLAFLVHGETKAAESLQGLLKERLDIPALVPSLDQGFDLLAALEEHGRPAEISVQERGESPAETVEAAAKVPASKLDNGLPEGDLPLRGAPREPRPAPPMHVQPLPGESPIPAYEDPAVAERLEQIMASPSYRRADLDTDFLERPDMRASRIHLEYLKPEILLQEHGVEGTIVVFGGSRIREEEVARRKLEEARAEAERHPKDPYRRIRVQVAERILAKSRYYQVARDFGRLVGEVSNKLGGHKLLIVTGGGPGIMEAGNRGAFDADAPSVGLNIDLPHEQFPNPYITPELCFEFRYFALRKMHFLMRARAMVAFPGGYGTLDELFQTLCLIQTREIPPMPVCLVGEEFWKGVIDIEYLAAEGVIDLEDRDLFWFADTAEDAWNGILEWYRKAGEPLL